MSSTESRLGSAMSLRRWTLCAVGAALLGFGALPARADDTQLADALRAVVAGNIAAYNRDDVDATMSFIDTASPDYDPTKTEIAQQFKDLETNTELVDFKYIGHDDEFAVARVKTKVIAKGGSAFVNNVVDSIMIFHQQNGSWKLWSEKILGVQPLP